MTWQALLALIEAEAGKDVASRIAKRAEYELAGVRLTITSRRPITAEQIDAVAPGRPLKAARALGVHHSTVYRALLRKRLLR